jgi:hypothetical protein
MIRLALLLVFLMTHSSLYALNSDKEHLHCDVECFTDIDESKLVRKSDHQECELDPVTLKPIDPSCEIDGYIPPPKKKKAETISEKKQEQLEIEALLDDNVKPSALPPLKESLKSNKPKPKPKPITPKEQQKPTPIVKKEPKVTPPVQTATKKPTTQKLPTYYIQVGLLVKNQRSPDSFERQVNKMGYELHYVLGYNKRLKTNVTFLVIGDFKGYTAAKKALKKIHRSLTTEAYILSLKRSRALMGGK